MRRIIVCIAATALLALYAWQGRSAHELRPGVFEASAARSGSATPAVPSLPRRTSAARAAHRARFAADPGQEFDDSPTAYEAVADLSARRSAEQMSSARQRFAQAESNSESSGAVERELRAQLDALGVDSRGLARVECRGQLCRIDLQVAESKLMAVAAAARASKLRTGALEVAPGGTGEVRVFAYVEPI